MKPKSVFRAHFLIAVFASCLLAQPAMAQKTYRGMLYLCLRDKFPDVQLGSDANSAFVPSTGQNLAWDADKKTWIDTKTGQSVLPFKTLRGATYSCCLRKKFPDVQLGSDANSAFVPSTGQNLAWDSTKQAWIDVKTGKCVCPECEPKKTPPPKPPVEHAMRETVIDPFELQFGYNYINAPDEEEVKDLHGFNASLFVNVNSWLAFGGEFAAGFGDETFRIANDDVDVSLDRYLYLFGPRVSVRPTERFRIFAQAMVGGVHDNTDVTISGPGGFSANSSASADSWAFDFGVGADWRLTNHWSWRIIQADYLATTFSSFNNDHWQDNWRLSTGIVFSFGGKEPPRPNDYSKERPFSAK